MNDWACERDRVSEGLLVATEPGDQNDADITASDFVPQPPVGQDTHAAIATRGRKGH
jgi:hypothetical protein